MSQFTPTYAGTARQWKEQLRLAWIRMEANEAMTLKNCGQGRNEGRVASLSPTDEDLAFRSPTEINSFVVRTRRSTQQSRCKPAHFEPQRPRTERALSSNDTTGKTNKSRHSQKWDTFSFRCTVLHLTSANHRTTWKPGGCQCVKKCQTWKCMHIGPIGEEIKKMQFLGRPVAALHWQKQSYRVSHN